MPLVEVTHSPVVSEQTLTKLADALAHVVSIAVHCPEEPYDGHLQPGDVEIRFHQLGPFDRSGLDVVIEVRSKWFESRDRNRQDRVDQLHRDVAAATGLENFGVYLSLPVAAWAQSE
jgi:hypothetical protein